MLKLLYDNLRLAVRHDSNVWELFPSLLLWRRRLDLDVPCEEQVTLDEALKLFDLPKDLGEFEEKTVSVGVGKFGPYVRHDNKYISIPKGIDPLAISLDEAIKLIEEKRDEDRRRVLRTFEEDPELRKGNVFLQKKQKKSPNLC